MKIMLTYVGGIAGQSVIKMIRRSKYKDIIIIGLDSDKNAVGLKWCDLAEVVPSADYFYDLGYQEEYTKIIEREKPDLILPTGEEDLEFLSQFSNSFMNTKYMVQLCQDKYLFYKHFKKDYGDFLPKTSDSPMDFDSLPIITKPMIGRGSRGFRLIKDFTTLADVQKFGEYMYQEYLPGQVSPQHEHGTLSRYSWVYYLDVGENSSPLTFVELEDNKNELQKVDEIHLPVYNDMIVMFPSIAHHKVYPCKTKRYVLAGNINDICYEDKE